MTVKTDFDQQGNSSLDWLKWLVAVVLLLAGIVANHIYSAQPWALRLVVWIALAAVVLGILSRTRIGKSAISFIRESRIELQKVYWPTRQETMQTTLVVGAMVIVLALMLWGIDGVLVWLIGWLTGQRG